MIMYRDKGYEYGGNLIYAIMSSYMIVRSAKEIDDLKEEKINERKKQI